MAPLALVPNLATRWRHLHWLQIWPPDGPTCISYKFSHQVESLALVAKLATSSKFGHQMAPSKRIFDFDKLKGVHTPFPFGPFLYRIFFTQPSLFRTETCDPDDMYYKWMSFNSLILIKMLVHTFILNLNEWTA